MDYKAIIDNLSDQRIKELLDNLHIPYEDKGEYILCKTACHNIDLDSASSKLYYYKDNHFFYCYSECGGMSIFNFLKHYYKTRNIEYDWYQDIYLPIIGCSDIKSGEGFEIAPYESLKDRYGNKRGIKKLETYSENVMDCFVKIYPEEWLSDGISKAAMDKFNIKYSISQNKIIIPHYDIDNHLVGIRGRALNAYEVENVGKYAPIKIEQTWYKHPLSMNLYGLNFNKENIQKTGLCFLFESEKSVMQCESFSMPNCSVAVCGSNFNKYQLNLLLKYCSPQEIVICFDKEERPGEDSYYRKLRGICDKYKNYCRFSFIYDNFNHLSLKDSPSDRGEETFKQLLKERIKVT